MPFQDFNLKATFDEAYDIGIEGATGHPNTRPEVRLHYHRSVLYPTIQHRATRIIAAMGWTAPGPKLVVLGAGFGWLAESFETDHGFTHVVGLDTSAYIQNEKNGTEASEIDEAILAAGLDPTTGTGLSLKNAHHDGGNRDRTSRGVRNNDLSTGQMKNEVKNALDLSGNQKPDVILTESVIENLTDSEFQAEAARVRDLTNQLIHYVQTTHRGSTPGMYNWHTLAEWKALAPLDTFIEAGTFVVL